jgi:hypothetical protein
VKGLSSALSRMMDVKGCKRPAPSAAWIPWVAGETPNAARQRIVTPRYFRTCLVSKAAISRCSKKSSNYVRREPGRYARSSGPRTLLA